MHFRPEKLLRDQRATVLTAADQTVLGPNPLRWALVFSLSGGISALGHAVQVTSPGASTATAGVKAQLSVPAGQEVVVNSATFFETAGTGVVAALQWNGSVNLAQYTTSGVFPTQVVVPPQTVLNWNVVTAIAASTSDFFIGGIAYPQSYRVTISFKGPAVLDQGLTMYPGQPPLVLMYDHMGQAIQEEIHAVCDQPAVSLEILEIFMSKD